MSEDKGRDSNWRFWIEADPRAILDMIGVVGADTKILRPYQMSNIIINLLHRIDALERDAHHDIREGGYE